MLQQTLLDTPWWVYAIFIYVIYRAIVALRTRIIPVKNLFIFPVIIVMLTGRTLLTMTTLSLVLVINGLIAFVSAFIIGWWLTKIRKIKVDRQQGLLQVQRSWISLIVLLVIFGIHYYVGYMNAVYPEIAQQLFFVHCIFTLNSIIMGIIVGRLAHYLYCYKTQASVSLK